MKSFLFVFTVCLLAQVISADSMLVTVQYDSGKMMIKHMELMSGSANANYGLGPLVLAYQTNSGVMPVYSFSMPVLNTDGSFSITDHLEQTMAIPYESGATALSLYYENGTHIDSLSLSGITRDGDSKGTPPSDSIAGTKGGKSVVGAVEGSISPSSSNSNTSTDSEEGICGPAFVLLGVLAGVGLLSISGKK